MCFFLFFFLFFCFFFLFLLFFFFFFFFFFLIIFLFFFSFSFFFSLEEGGSTRDAFTPKVAATGVPSISSCAFFCFVKNAGSRKEGVHRLLDDSWPRLEGVASDFSSAVRKRRRGQLTQAAQQSQEEGTETENSTGQGMGSENGAYLNTPPQILPVLGLYLPHLTRGSLSLNRLTTPPSNLCSCHPRLSAFLQHPQSPTVAILTQVVPKKCAHPRTHYDARVVEIQGRPEIFHNSSGPLPRATENRHSKYNICQNLPENASWKVW